ncbi:conserved hypothetical protein [Nitrosopumilaceae archaeon]|nr:hypothetical protein [Nitrosopumilus sp.]CAI9831185.1 conserved hypothetical protein [Nitrosopumilaceae archaeon]MDA7945246.1 hypothetical protein [Nitrosopumilus sp.]MDA7954969.1 hypothetical protein [Nitrosopumilus sp.]MDA7973871.1 hypothetical protein [Nitrosopumilus sp.]
MMQYTALLCAGVAVIAAMGIIFGADVLRMAAPVAEYSVFVDPVVENQNLFVTGRVTIHNTGTRDLTNMEVDFGGGDRLELGTLASGKSVIVSPPDGNAMEFVVVSADNGILEGRSYREPPKMVGMMGS